MQIIFRTWPGFSKLAATTCIRPTLPHHDPAAVRPFLDSEKTTRVRFSRIKCPVFAAGRQDRATPSFIARSIAKRYAKSEYREYNASHWIITEPAIEEIVKDVDSWLGVNGAGGSHSITVSERAGEAHWQLPG